MLFIYYFPHFYFITFTPVFFLPTLYNNTENIKNKITHMELCHDQKVLDQS